MQKSIYIILFIGVFFTSMLASNISLSANAIHKEGHFAQDNKNNPTLPGGQFGKDSPPEHANNENARDSDPFPFAGQGKNCDAHQSGEVGAGSENLPAQCY